MPPKKSTFRRKRRNMPRKSFRKVPRALPMRANVLSSKRFVVKATHGGSDTVPSSGAAQTFTLNDIPGNTDFTNLFEEYQIAGIAYRFVVNRNPDFATVNKGFPIRIMMVHDHNDSTAPGSFAELQQYPNVRELWLGADRPTSRWYWLKPNTINVGYTSGVASNYGVDYKRWIDTGNTFTPYYGLKYLYDQNYAGITLFLECKYYVKLKNVK